MGWAQSKIGSTCGFTQVFPAIDTDCVLSVIPKSFDACVIKD